MGQVSVCGPGECVWAGGEGERVSEWVTDVACEGEGVCYGLS